MAFVGVVVGAGFASGQEAIQFFVAFGPWGIVGAVISSVLISITGMIVLRFGSYWMAQEHTAVLNEVAGRPIALLLDVGVMITLFSVGFVMFAGAGANLQQQFGLPLWVGSAIMIVLTMATGFLDIDKVSTVIGACTPFIIMFIVLATVYAITQAPSDLSTLDAATAQVQTGLPNWWVSCLNYVGFNLIVGASMAIVIGGVQTDTRAAGWGGFLGGLIFSALVLCLVVSLWLTLPIVGQESMPTLALVNHIHPWLGIAMAIVIYAMIYNTAIGMFYSMSRRATASRPHLFRRVYLGFCVIGIVLSTVGFKSLVSFLYPILGYVGLVLIAVLFLAYLRHRRQIDAEIKRRETIRALLIRKLDPRKMFTRKHASALQKAVEESPAESEILQENLTGEVVDELVADETVDFTAADAARVEAEGLGDSPSKAASDLAKHPAS
ncbi:YkvI family membrane protein [Corynebacterium epidermidicanis]|nr:hypothetical protein [Corynebacterium epidermidicanis]